MALRHAVELGPALGAEEPREPRLERRAMRLPLVPSVSRTATASRSTNKFIREGVPRWRSSRFAKEARAATERLCAHPYQAPSDILRARSPAHAISSTTSRDLGCALPMRRRRRELKSSFRRSSRGHGLS